MLRVEQYLRRIRTRLLELTDEGMTGAIVIKELFDVSLRKEDSQPQCNLGSK